MKTLLCLALTCLMTLSAPVYADTTTTRTTVIENQPAQSYTTVTRSYPSRHHDYCHKHHNHDCDDCDHDGGLFDALGEVLAFPFRAVGAVIDGIF